MNLKAAKIVPKLINFEQTQRPMDIAQEMLSTFNDDPDFLFPKLKTPMKAKPLPRIEEIDEKSKQ